MEFKGTKGEWYLSGSTFVTTINEDICDVFVHLEAYMDKQNEEQKIKAEANAKLISCAPEMLEKLIELHNDLKQGAMPCGNELYDLNELIKKATTI